MNVNDRPGAWSRFWKRLREIADAMETSGAELHQLNVNERLARLERRADQVEARLSPAVPAVERSREVKALGPPVALAER